MYLSAFKIKTKNICKIFCTVTFILIFYIQLKAQQAPTIKIENDYKSWGWDAWVMQNDLVTVATVPVIGARIMQYDLDGHPSIYVNPGELGKTYTPSSSAPSRNFGGFKNWPAPQSEWNWPPPPTLDYGSYEAVADTSIDSVSLVVTSPIEQWLTPDLRFKRRTTVYKNTSRVKVEQTIINESSEPQHWSVWDITQTITTHSGQNDFENFWVYFPINPESSYENDGIYLDLRGASTPSSGWTGEVAPGIYGVQYSPDYQKLFADSHIGWVCYVDELNGYAYAKTFRIVKDADYPDDGAHVEIWLNNFPYYVEVEVVSPIVELDADGGSYTFTEDWYAAKVNGPIISVTNAGAVKSFEYDFKTEHFTGEFGVFNVGSAQLEFTDSLGTVLDSSSAYSVTPLETFTLDDSTSAPEEADSVRIIIKDNDGTKIGVLASEALEKMTTGMHFKKNINPIDMMLEQNYPNPFNPKTVISWQLPVGSYVDLSIYNIMGQKVYTLVSENQKAGNHKIEWNASGISSGIYLYRIKAGDFVQTKRMLLIK